MNRRIRQALVGVATAAMVVSGLIAGAPQSQAARGAQTDSVPTLYIDMVGTYYRTTIANPPVTTTSPAGAFNAVNGSGSHTIAGGATYEMVDPANPSNNFVDLGTLNSTGGTDYGEIRGRGNYTWKTLPVLNTFPSWTAPATFSAAQVSKRPYQMKLSSGQNVLGMGSGKTWILLANHADASLMRNKVALDLAAEFGLAYTPQARFIDLVVNGSYLGSYLMTEKVQEGSARVVLKNTQGVLVEMDNNYYADEPPQLQFATSKTKTHFVLKDVHKGKMPDPDPSNNVTLSDEQAAGWASMRQTLNALDEQLNSASPDWTTVSNLIDVDSFVKFYFLQEFTENPEIARSSIYFYKDGPSDKLHAGPAWDFDSSMGSYSATNLGGNPEVYYTRYISSYRTGNNWFQQLFRMGQFDAAARSMYVGQLKLAVDESLAKVGRYQTLLAASANKNFQKWPILGRNRLFPPFTGLFRSTWEGEVNDLRSYMIRRAAFLNNGYAPGVPATASDCNATPASAAIGTPGAFNALSPCRMLDTRTGNGARGPIASDGVVALKVTGRGGVPESGVLAVVMNVTVAGPTHQGFITAYPSGSATVPDASNLNFVPGQVVPNQVTVKVGGDGIVNLKNSVGGTTHLIADVAGFFVGGDATAPGAFVAVSPERILDTRKGLGAAAVAVPANGSIDLQVTSATGVVPATAGAVALNITATEPTANGHVTVYPTGGTAPQVSNVNFVSGQTVPNAATVKLGTDGKLTLVNGASGTVHLIVDVNGYYLGGTATAPGMFVPVTPSRILDSREGIGIPKTVESAANSKRMLNNFETLQLKVAGVGVVSATDAGAVAMNVTVAGPTQLGYLTVFPEGATRPAVSSVNFARAQNVPNMVTVKIGTGGIVDLYAMNAGQTHVIADVAGYYIK